MPAAGGFPQHSSGTFWDLPFGFPFSVVLYWVFGLFFFSVLSFFLSFFFLFSFFASGTVPGCALRVVWFDWKSD